MYNVETARPAAHEAHDQAFGGSFGFLSSSDSVSPTLVSESAVMSRLTWAESAAARSDPTHGDLEIGVALERVELAEHGLERDGVRLARAAPAEQLGRVAAASLQRAQQVDQRRLRLR